MDTENEVMNIPNTPFSYSAVAPENLGEPEYTLVSFIRDKSGSVSPFDDEISKALNISLDACRKSPRSENLLVRAGAFNESLTEIHGFTELSKLPDYRGCNCNGGTSLFDAVYSALGATVAYANKLRSMDYSVNAIIFITTDGQDNSSTFRAQEIKTLIDDLIQKEEIGSITTVLIGVNDQGSLSTYLTDFKNEAGLTQYVSLGDATAGKLARLGGFISKSISSSSQSLASGTVVSVADLTF